MDQETSKEPHTHVPFDEISIDWLFLIKKKKTERGKEGEHSGCDS